MTDEWGGMILAIFLLQLVQLPVVVIGLFALIRAQGRGQ